MRDDDVIVGAWAFDNGQTEEGRAYLYVGQAVLDCNGNGVDDADDIANATSQDCNTNGIPDECDIASGSSPNCNSNGIPDECETDCNANGIPDECETIGTKYCTANPNSAGAPADITANGSASSSAGDLMLTSAPVPNQPGIFVHGENQSQNAFGNGFLCTTGGITRGTVVSASANSASYTYDKSDAQHSLAAFVSTTRNFQHWYRDPMGGGAFFNTSNAISIAVLP